MNGATGSFGRLENEVSLKIAKGRPFIVKNNKVYIIHV